MALRRLLTAALLVAAASTHGVHQPGELATPSEGAAGSGHSDIPSPANTNAAGDEFSPEDKVMFVGMNICGFDFGW